MHLAMNRFEIARGREETARARSGAAALGNARARARALRGSRRGHPKLEGVDVIP
jgi:hypothetical protein